MSMPGMTTTNPWSEVLTQTVQARPTFLKKIGWTKTGEHERNFEY
jgi:hypothetical protein